MKRQDDVEADKSLDISKENRATVRAVASDADKLRICGHALYGPLWQARLAQALKVNPRTLRRWRAGELTISLGVWDEIRELLLAHATALAIALQQIS